MGQHGRVRCQYGVPDLAVPHTCRMPVSRNDTRRTLNTHTNRFPTMITAVLLAVVRFAVRSGSSPGVTSQRSHGPFDPIPGTINSTFPFGIERLPKRVITAGRKFPIKLTVLT